MFRRLWTLVTLVLLVHLARPDQLSDSYLAVQATPLLGHTNNQQPSNGLSQQLDQIAHHQNQPHKSSDKSHGFHSRPTTTGIRAQASKPRGQAADTNRLILLTDGQQIKLFPLDQSSSPSGGHYVIKPNAFNLSDERVRTSLAATNPRHLEMLQLKQKAVGASSKEQRRSSILPSKQSALNSEVDVSSVWRDPFIASLGFFLNDSFCHRDRRDQIGSRLSSASSCLVIYWLDSANAALHLGLLELNYTNKLSLLETRFDSQGTARASNAINTLKLDQFPPLDLCNELGRADCRPAAVQVDAQSSKLYVSFSSGDSSEGLIFSSVLEPLARPVRQLKLSSKNLVQVGGFVAKSAGLLRNLIGDGRQKRSQLLYMKDDNKILAVDLESSSEATTRKPLESAPLKPSGGRTSIFLDAQWETTKMKVRRSRSNKLNGTFGIQAMALAEPDCALVWLTTDNELYSSSWSLAGNHNSDTHFLGKLVATRPLIRPPINAMQPFRDSIFFTDSTRRSLMAYKLPGLQASGELQQTREQEDQEGERVASSSVRDERVPQLGATHRVLLVEMAPIQDFVLIELGGSTELACGSFGAGGQPALRRRNHELQISKSDWLPRVSKEPPAAQVATASPSVAFVPTTSVTSADELEPASELSESIEVVLDDQDEAGDKIVYLQTRLNQLRGQFEMLLVLLLLIMLASLICLNCYLWRHKSRLLALIGLNVNLASTRRAGSRQDDEHDDEHGLKLPPKTALAV